MRNSIISRSIPLVRSIIGKISRPNNPLAELEDLESVGISGLIEALNSYDSSKNIQFNTFAYYRIQGSIIDYLRKIDNLPRNKRKSYGQVQNIIAKKLQELGREPSDDEVAEELGIPLAEYHDLLSTVQQRNALSLDRSSSDNAENLYDIYADPDSQTPDQDLERKEMVNTLKEKVSSLNERDRLILTLYYYEDMTMSEIALLLDLTEARISQIVGRLLLKLKQNLSKEEFSL
ncbi:MAG: FliA/WhiG family RNA polymerase sigma factor [Balneolia bacterium]|nr:FliA/WhiG family RNA polymerase sigma factor [Balneolia bacterium]